MSPLTAELPLIPVQQPHDRRARSEMVPRGDFPRAVNWGNPRVAAILDAAAQCFSARGFTATTLADIGKELGLRKSIVHYYFKSKSTLVEEVQSYAYNRYVELISSALFGWHDPSDAAHAPHPDGPVSEPPASAERSIAPRDQLRTGLMQLWQDLKSQATIRGLSLELWSEGRRNEELCQRAQTLEGEAHRLVKDFIVQHRPTPPSSSTEADDLATITLALLDGLTVREEREGASLSTARAFDTFIRLLER